MEVLQWQTLETVPTWTGKYAKHVGWSIFENTQNQNQPQNTQNQNTQEWGTWDTGIHATIIQKHYKGLVTDEPPPIIIVSTQFGWADIGKWVEFRETRQEEATWPFLALIVSIHQDDKVLAMTAWSTWWRKSLVHLPLPERVVAARHAVDGLDPRKPAMYREKTAQSPFRIIWRPWQPYSARHMLDHRPPWFPESMEWRVWWE